MQYQIPDNVLKYAEMAYAAASGKIDDQYDVQVADLRQSLGTAGLAHSSVMDRESARLSAERISALVRARADALMDGYELHAKLDDVAAKATLEDISKLWENLTSDLVAKVTNRAKSDAWRTRTSGAAAIVQARDFGREVERLSAPVLNEVGCEIERRRVMPKLGLQTAALAAKPTAVRPVGPYSYHAEIQRVSQRLCDEGNFRQAVLDAFIQLIDTVRAKTGLPYDGDDLMNRAFSPDGRTPPVRFNAFQTQGEKDEQRGIWMLFKGVVNLRNFKAHVVATFADPDRAHEYLALASLLMRLLEAATFDPATPPSLTH